MFVVPAPIVTAAAELLTVCKPFVVPFLVRLAAAFGSASLLLSDVEPVHWTWYARLGSFTASLVVIALALAHAASSCTVGVGAAVAMLPSAVRRLRAA